MPTSTSINKSTNLTVLMSICLLIKCVTGPSTQKRLMVISEHVILGGRCTSVKRCTKPTVWQERGFTALSAERLSYGCVSVWSVGRWDAGTLLHSCYCCSFTCACTRKSATEECQSTVLLQRNSAQQPGERHSLPRTAALQKQPSVFISFIVLVV